MSAIRPSRTGNYWSLHTDATGTAWNLDTFQMLVAPTISSVVDSGTQLDINITNPNAGCDTTNFTNHIMRSVDGGAFAAIVDYVAGPVTTISDLVKIGTYGTTWIRADGSIVTAPAAGSYYTLSNTSVLKAALLFDTIVTTVDGHSRVLPSGTIVTFGPGNSYTSAATPKGHTYAYKVSVQNKFMTTALSASNSIAVASALSAQVQSALSRTDNKMTLTWTDSNTYGTGDRIEIWKDVDGAGYSLMATLIKAPSVPMPTSYVDAFDFLTLVPATYSYKLRAAVSIPQDTGAFSNIQSLVVSFSLSQVTALTATPAFGDTQIGLTWTDPNLVADEAGLHVERAKGAAGQFQRIATVAPGVAAYTDVFATEPGQTYAYRVIPFNSLHAGPSSSTALATTSMTTPSITSLEQLSDVGIRIFWSDINKYASTYTVERDVNGGGYSIAGMAAGPDRQIDDFVSLAIGDVVTYRIKASNTYVASAYSSTMSTTVHNTLVAPTGVTPTYIRFGIISVSWTGLNIGNRGVKLYRSTNGGAMTLIATLPKPTRSYTDTFQTISGHAYAYQAQDFNNQETGPLSAVGVTTDPLDGPVSLQITSVSLGRAALQWTSAYSPQSTNEDYTSVERAFGTGGTFNEAGRVSYGQQPTISVSTIGGVPGDVVSFRVRKIKLPYTILGNVTVPTNYGEYSETVSTLSNLSVPTAVTVTRSTSGVNHIAWSDTNTLATGFKVFRQTTISGIVSPRTLVGIVNSAAIHDHDDTVDAVLGEIFTYDVLAFNENNSSIVSGSGTLTSRFSAPSLELEQSLRTQIKVYWRTSIGAGIAGDQVQLFKSINGATAVVVTTINQPFSDGFLYTDNSVSIDQTISYSLRYICATEVGPLSVPQIITIGDIINTPLIQIKQIRIHGARNKFVQRDVLAVGSNGISRVSYDINYDPVVTSSNAYVGATSGIAGDQTRFIVFTNAIGTHSAHVVDAGTLANITQTPLLLSDNFMYSGGLYQYGAATFIYYEDMIGANYDDGATGNYLGWGLVNYTPTVNMNSDYPLRLIPWTSAPSTINLSSFYVNGSLSGQTAVVLPFLIGSILPRRLENLNGDCAFCVRTANSTIVYRATRTANSYFKLTTVSGWVIDMVSDGVSRLLLVTIKGDIILIDMQFGSTNPSLAVIGHVPMDPINANGDLINVSDPYRMGHMSIELLASRKVAVMVGTYPQPESRRFDNTLTSLSKVFVFDIPGVLSTSTSLTLSKTVTSIEKLTSIAFDGMKYIYATSSTNECRLTRFNAGF